MGPGSNSGASLQCSDGCTCRGYCCRWVCYGPFSSSQTREERKDNNIELQSSCEGTTVKVPVKVPASSVRYISLVLSLGLLFPTIMVCELSW